MILTYDRLMTKNTETHENHKGGLPREGAEEKRPEVNDCFKVKHKQAQRVVRILPFKMILQTATHTFRCKRKANNCARKI